jgi:hypothetical protein
LRASYESVDCSVAVAGCGRIYSGGDTAAAGSLIEAVADALSPTKAPLRASAQEQKPTVSGARHRHRLVRRYPQTPDPRTAFAQARASSFVDAHAVTADEEERALKPRRVATMRGGRGRENARHRQACAKSHAAIPTIHGMDCWRSRSCIRSDRPPRGSRKGNCRAPLATRANLASSRAFAAAAPPAHLRRDR